MSDEPGRATAVAEGPTADICDYYRTIAPFYDLELSSRGDEPFWRRLGRCWAGEGRRVLELGAGSGRVTAWLLDAGADVTAVDLSPDMLAQAARRLGDRPGLRLVQADMRDLDLGAGERFDLVLAADDPFSHLADAADRDAALAVVARHLKPSGRFVLDALWFPPSARRAMAAPGGRASRRVIVADGQMVRVRERWRSAPVATATRCHARYAYLRPGRREVEVTAEFTARAWTLRELPRRLARAGLQIEHRWGDFGGHPFDPATSRHLLIQARPLDRPAPAEARVGGV